MQPINLADMMKRHREAVQLLQSPLSIGKPARKLGAYGSDAKGRGGGPKLLYQVRRGVEPAAGDNVYHGSGYVDW